MPAVIPTLVPLLGALMLLGPGNPVPARDRGADGHFDHRRSSHFVLFQDVDIDRYSGPRGSRRFERNVLDVLEDAYDRVDRLLGIRPVRPVEVVVYDAGIFDERFGGLFGFRAAGFYHGVIRVRGSDRLSTALLRTLQHEYVHAALDGAAPSLRLPAWLNEGLAEWVEADAVGKNLLNRSELGRLAEAERRGVLPGLEELGGPSLAGLPPERASLAYLKSYAMVEHMVRRHGEPQLRRFVTHLLRTGNLEGSLRRAYRRTSAELEIDLVRELR